MPWVITSQSQSELALSDLQYVEPELRLPVFPSTSMATQQGPDAVVRPPPRRKNIPYGQWTPQLTEVGGNPSTDDDRRPRMLSASVSSSSLITTGSYTGARSLGSIFVDGSVRPSRPEPVLPDCYSGTIEPECRSKTPSHFTSPSSSSPAQSRHRTHVQSVASPVDNALKPPSSSSNATVSLRRNASSESRTVTGGAACRERSSLSVSVDGQSDESDAVRRSPMSDPRKVSKRDRVSVLATAVHWQQRNVKSLPSSPEISRVNGASSLVRPSPATRSGTGSPTGSDELLSKSPLPKVTIRPAETKHRPSPAKLQISKVWTSAASGSDPESPKETVPSTDAVIKVGVSSGRGGGSSQASNEAVNVSDKPDAGAGDELTAEQLQSLTVNPYLCLIADDYSATSNSSLSTGGRVVDGPQKRRLSSSLSDVNGTHLFKERPFSASMININRPLPEIPSTNNRGRQSDGSRGPFPSSIGSLSTKPLKKLFSLVTRRKFRRSGIEKNDGVSPPVDDDADDDDEREPETADQSPTTAIRFVGERHVYEPLRQSVVGDASPADDVNVGHCWRTVSEIPTDVQHFTVREIADCLRLLKMERYAEQFAEQDVDGALLVSMDEDLLQDSFGMTGLEAKKIFQFAKKGWRPRT